VKPGRRLLVETENEALMITGKLFGQLTDPRDFFDPTPGLLNVVLIKVRNSSAQRMIAGCEACNEHAELPFDNILDRLTRSDPSGSSELH
jgi:hypothetical protein